MGSALAARRCADAIAIFHPVGPEGEAEQHDIVVGRARLRGMHEIVAEQDRLARRIFILPDSPCIVAVEQAKAGGVAACRRHQRKCLPGCIAPVDMEVRISTLAARDQEAGVHPRLLVKIEHRFDMASDPQSPKRAFEQSIAFGRARADPADVAVPSRTYDREMARWPPAGQRQEFANDCRIDPDRPGGSCSRQPAQRRRAFRFVPEHAPKLAA